MPAAIEREVVGAFHGEVGNVPSSRGIFRRALTRGSDFIDSPNESESDAIESDRKPPLDDRMFGNVLILDYGRRDRTPPPFGDLRYQIEISNDSGDRPPRLRHPRPNIDRLIRIRPSFSIILNPPLPKAPLADFARQEKTHEHVQSNRNVYQSAAASPDTRGSRQKIFWIVFCVMRCMIGPHKGDTMFGSPGGAILQVFDPAYKTPAKFIFEPARSRRRGTVRWVCPGDGAARGFAWVSRAGGDQHGDPLATAQYGFAPILVFRGRWRRRWSGMMRSRSGLTGIIAACTK